MALTQRDAAHGFEQNVAHPAASPPTKQRVVKRVLETLRGYASGVPTPRYEGDDIPGPPSNREDTAAGHGEKREAVKDDYVNALELGHGQQGDVGQG